MAVEKDKVLAAIETKFKGKSITKTFKENIAAKWAAKIENEDDIESYIDDREDVILEAVSEADRRATDAAKKASEKKVEKEKEKETEEDELPEDTPAWAKALVKQNKDLADKVSGFEKAQQSKSLEERFRTHEKIKDIPEFILEGRIPTTEEDFEDAVNRTVTGYEKFAQDQNITRFGKDNPAGNKGGGGETGKVSPIVKQLAENINKESKN